MSDSDSNRTAAGATPPPSGESAPTPSATETAAPERIVAIKLRHPLRNIFAAVLLILVALFIVDASQREAYSWDSYAKYIFDRRITQAAFVTLQLTIYAMVIAVVLGLLVAVMRLSPNPVVKGIAWLYLWIFRGTPVYVQLVFWGLLSTIYQTIDIGIPFTEPWIQFQTSAALSYFTLAVIGLALNEAAYMAEIVRAGILSVDAGQEEAATALGMSWFQTMRRVVIPQSMRVIIPPTGNEVISMLKTTSLVTAVPFSLDLYTRSRDISAETYNPIPMLIVASTWYLLFTSILMVGQYFLEKRFARGVADRRPNKKADALTTTFTGALPVVAAGQPTVLLPPPRDPDSSAPDSPASPADGDVR